MSVIILNTISKRQDGSDLLVKNSYDMFHLFLCCIKVSTDGVYVYFTLDVTTMTKFDDLLQRTWPEGARRCRGINPTLSYITKHFYFVPHRATLLV